MHQEKYFSGVHINSLRCVFDIFRGCMGRCPEPVWKYAKSLSSKPLSLAHSLTDCLSGLVRVGTTLLYASWLYRGHLALIIAYLAWVHHFLASGCRSSFQHSSIFIKTDRRMIILILGSKLSVLFSSHRKLNSSITAIWNDISHSLFVDCFQVLAASVWPGPIRTQTRLCDLAGVPYFQTHAHTPTLKSFVNTKFPFFF